MARVVGGAGTPTRGMAARLTPDQAGRAVCATEQPDISAVDSFGNRVGGDAIPAIVDAAASKRPETGHCDAPGVMPLNRAPLARLLVGPVIVMILIVFEPDQVVS
jgi:hypothetical protein